MTMPNITIPLWQSKGDLFTKMTDRKMLQGIAREISIYPDPVYRPPP